MTRMRVLINMLTVVLPHQHMSVYAVEQYDPTRTLTLRTAFARQMTLRFTQLVRAIEKAVVEEDCFALEPTSGGFAVAGYAALVTPGRHAFDFPRSADKITAFMKWLKRQQQAGILEVIQYAQLGQGTDQAWTDTYVRSAYQRGIARARQELIKQKGW